MRKSNETIINEVLSGFDFETVERIRNIELALDNASSRLTQAEMRKEAVELIEDVLKTEGCHFVSSFGFQAFKIDGQVILQYVVTEKTADVYGRK